MLEFSVQAKDSATPMELSVQKTYKEMKNTETSFQKTSGHIISSWQSSLQPYMQSKKGCYVELIWLSKLSLKDVCVMPWSCLSCHIIKTKCPRCPYYLLQIHLPYNADLKFLSEFEDFGFWCTYSPGKLTKTPNKQTVNSTQNKVLCIKLKHERGWKH